jgi:hypothetical protein
MIGKLLILFGLFALAVAVSPHVSTAAPLSPQGAQLGKVDPEEALAHSIHYRRYGACPRGWDFNYRAGRCIRRYGACPHGWNWNGYRCVRWY